MLGILGFVKTDSKIKNCSNFANITSQSSGYCCGIRGMGEYYRGIGNIDRCINFGNLIGNRDVYGIGCASKITNSYNVGKIKSNNSCSACGIGSAGIYNCMNEGNIISTGEYSIYSTSGGIYGYMSNGLKSLNIINCYNTGELSTKCYKGSIIGCVRACTPTTLNCFYLQQGYSGEYAQTTPYTEEQLKNESFIEELNNYIESNSDGIDTTGWAKWIKGADGYPTLDFSIIWDGSKWVNS